MWYCEGGLTDPLPLCHPAVFRLAQSHHPLEVGRGAVVDILSVVSQAQECLAVVAPVVFELVERLDDGAGETGAQLAQILGDRLAHPQDVAEVEANSKDEHAMVGFSVATGIAAQRSQFAM